MNFDIDGAIKYTKEHMLEYFLLVIVQSLFMIVGTILIGIGVASISAELPTIVYIFAIISSIIGTVIICYSLWQLMLIYGALMYSICATLKSKEKTRIYTIKECLPLIKNRQQSYIFYLLFVSLVTILPMSVMFISFSIKLLGVLLMMPVMLSYILLMPFFIFSFPAFILKGDSISLIDLFPLVYKKLDINGVLLIIIVMSVSGAIMFVASIIPILNFILSPLAQLALYLITPYLFTDYFIKRLKA